MTRLHLCRVKLWDVADMLLHIFSGVIHATSVMKGFECHGCAVRVYSVVVAIFEKITTLSGKQ